MIDTEGDMIQLSDEEMQKMIDLKYRQIYSERLGRKVYVLKKWVEKSIFKRHKKLFGYTDVGWTVKHPKQLIRVLLSEGIWELEQGISD